MKKRTVHLILDVQVPMSMSDAKVAELVNKLLEAGYAEAVATAELPDWDDPDARLLMKCSMGKPKVAK